MTIILKPLLGVEINHRLLPLGAPKSEVEAILGSGRQMENTVYYFQNDLRIDYDANKTVEFIEFLGGIDGSLQPLIYDVSAFETTADALYHILAEHNAGEIADNENGCSYAFYNLSVGLYRERTPNSIEEIIADMKADGVNIENNADLELEKKKANHWAAIGIGRDGYYR